MDTPNKPQISDGQDVAAPPVPAPLPSLPARNPFRPMSLRRRQAEVAERPAAVERPSTNLVFEASPATVAAALAKAGTSHDEASLAWRSSQNSGADVNVEEDVDAGSDSPR